MNKLAIVLIIIGIFQIIAGLVIGINLNYELLWIWFGIVTGVILFAFASMINLLQQNRDIAKKQLDVWKGHLLTQDEHSVEAEEDENIEQNDGYDELRKELREQGHKRDYIETIVDIRKRMGKK